jgi:class 3 adenylate cyclase
MRQIPRHPREICFDIDLPFPLGQVWKYCSNTDRMDRSWRLPIISYTHNPNDTGGSKRIGKLKVGPFTTKWHEHPYEWEKEKYFTVRRDYLGGPIRTFEIFFWFESLAPNMTRIHHVIGLDGNGLVSWLMSLALRWKVRTDVRKAYKYLEKFMAREDEKAPRAPYVPMACDNGFTSKVATSLRDRLIEARVDPAVGEKLIEHLRCAQEPDLAKMRAFRLAREWGMDPIQVLYGFLRATRAGVLTLSWDLLCPGCRGAKFSAESLSTIKNGAHCDACNIDFSVEFDRSVEVTFNVHPSIRQVRVATYCIGGPQNTPHVINQIRLGPQRKAKIEAVLGPGRYRVLSIQSKTTLELEVLPIPGELVEVPLSLEFGVGKPRGARKVILSLTNSHPHEITVMLENLKWMEDATTAAFVANLQEFRDLFSSEVLEPGQEIVVGAISLMFTDLKGSTAMYGRIGDASAFALVRDHFEILVDAVRAHEGALVKTIGDAVMGSFSRPENALKAALEIQAAIMQANSNGGIGGQRKGGKPEPLTVKIGLHHGPCFAVNLNERLDYFGTAVNIAARTEGQCKGGDIVLTSTMAAIPEVVEVLKSCGKPFETIEVSLKGFDERFKLCRVSCGAEAASQEKVVPIGLGNGVSAVPGSRDSTG